MCCDIFAIRENVHEDYEAKQQDVQGTHGAGRELSSTAFGRKVMMSL
jgi:hypothetical protein